MHISNIEHLSLVPGIVAVAVIVQPQLALYTAEHITALAQTARALAADTGPMLETAVQHAVLVERLRDASALLNTIAARIAPEAAGGLTFRGVECWERTLDQALTILAETDCDAVDIAIWEHTIVARRLYRLGSHSKEGATLVAVVSPTDHKVTKSIHHLICQHAAQAPRDGADGGRPR